MLGSRVTGLQHDGPGAVTGAPNYGAACCCGAASPPPLPASRAPPPSAPSQTACGRGPAPLAPVAALAWLHLLLPAPPWQRAWAAWQLPVLLQWREGRAPCPAGPPGHPAPPAAASCRCWATCPAPCPCACPAEWQQGRATAEGVVEVVPQVGQPAALLARSRRKQHSDDSHAEPSFTAGPRQPLPSCSCTALSNLPTQ